MPRLFSVWIIILNWNGLEDTVECLKSLQCVNTLNTDIHIIVIDNASSEDPQEKIKELFQNVTTIRLDLNYGFSGGCNYGIRMAIQANADYVLLLNNDTVVHPDFLEPLVDYLTKNTQVGVVSPLICYANEPERVWFAGAKIIFLLGYFQHKYLNQLRQSIPLIPITSDYVTGCCMLIPTSVIREVGLLDNKLFAYFEDTDFCIRLKKRGLYRICLPTSLIWHKESASTRRELLQGTTSPLKHYLMNRNRITIMLRYASRIELIVFFLFSGFFNTFYYLLAFAFRRRWKKMVWFMLGLVDGINQNFDRLEKMIDYRILYLLCILQGFYL